MIVVSNNDLWERLSVDQVKSLSPIMMARLDSKFASPRPVLMRNHMTARDRMGFPLVVRPRNTMTSWPGAVALITALFVAFLTQRVLGTGKSAGHNSALDGLRGFLAFGVFLHHGVVWYYHLQDGSWGRPPLVVYRELGLDCVNFFFMITAFLFVGKLIDGRERPVDWLRLYLGRFLRIAPLYLLVALALLAAVGHQTQWRLREPLSDVLIHSGRWLMLGTGGTPSVNAYAGTGMLIAFVTWTLAYEWLFYFSLPLIALLLRLRVPLPTVVVATTAAVLVAVGIANPFFPTAFVFGGLAAALARRPPLVALLRSRWAAVLTLLALAILLSGRVPHRAAMLVEAAAFCAVACGNTLFGLLSNRAAVALGEASYGIYLVHSLVLSVLILYVVGPDDMRALSPTAFWTFLAAIGALVVQMSCLTYRFIELPALATATPLAARMRTWRERRTARLTEY